MFRLRFLLPIASILGLFYLSLSLGDIKITQAQLWDVLSLGPNLKGESLNLLIWHLRMPEIILAFIVGGILALSGACLQHLLHNPLADPYLLGISSGSALGVAFAILFGFVGIYGMIALHLFGFAGAMLTLGLIYLFSRNQDHFEMNHLLMVGLAINMIMHAGLQFLMSQNPTKLSIVWQWMNGHLSGKTWLEVGGLFFVLIFALFVLIPDRKALALLLSGEEIAYALGVDVNRLKKKVLLCISLIVASSVAICGMIALVGMIVPQLVRISQPAMDDDFLIDCTLWGAVLLGICDLMVRILPFPLYLGTLTNALGGVAFLVFYLKRLNGLIIR